MNTEKIKKISILIFIFSVFFNTSEASLKIVEVMYDPEGGDENREWVKLYNDGEEDISIIGGKSSSSWRFIDKSPHYINDSITISPHKYAVLASDKNTFLNEYPSFSFPVADTTMSLPNTSGSVQISDGVNIIASFDYPSTSIEQSEIEDEEEYINEDNESENTNKNSKEEQDILRITTKINFPKVLMSGVPFSFYSTTTDNRKMTYNVGKFVWNFGDGNSLEVDNYGPFNYVYEYPGDYTVSLLYFDNSFTEIPDAIDKINIKVYPLNVYISGVGNSLDPYVEIENKLKYEVDLSNWSIATSSKVFVFPKGSSISSNNKIKIHSKITNFTEDDLKYLIIQNPRGDIISAYPSNNLFKNNISNSIKNTKIDNSNNNLKTQEEIIDLNNLTNDSSPKINFKDKWVTFSGLFIVILLGIISFFAIGKKKEYIKNDIENEVNADDFKILE